MMKHTTLTLFLLASLSLLGCRDGSTNVSTATPASKQTRTPSDTPGKTAAPVGLKYAFTNKVQSGLPVTIAITIIPALDADTLELRYTTSKLLVPGDNLTEFSFQNVPAQTAVTREITVIPQDDGLHRI